MTGRPNVAVVCDLAVTTGVGHALRCAALTEELVRRGLGVTFVVDPEAVPWVSRRIRAAGARIEHLAHDLELPEELRRRGFAALVFDSYLLDARVYDGARRAGLVTLAFVDDALRGASADILLDQNVGADEVVRDDLPAEVEVLAGLRYAVLRDEVVSRRPARPPVRGDVARPRVLAFLGGTDPFAAAPDLLRAVVGTAVPCDVRVVGANPDLVSELESVRPAEGQSIEVIGPTDSLGELMTEADVVLCAAGSSVWEVCTLGRAAGLLCLVDNQRAAYERLVASGVVADLGTLDALRSGESPAGPSVRRLLTDARRADQLSHAAWNLVDGRGKERVADALTARLADDDAVAP